MIERVVAPLKGPGRLFRIGRGNRRPGPASVNRAELGGNGLCFALYALLAAATVLPLLWARVPPLVDYSNHLARMWILVHRATNPELARNYLIHWRLLPDLGMDLVVPVLARVMPVVEAGRVFVALTMLGLVGGTMTLYRVLHGRFAIWPIWSVLFVYNAALFWGFVDCLFASALYLFAFAGWIASRNWRPTPRIAVFSAVAAGLFLLHLVAFGLYGLSVAAYELGRRIERRRLPLRNVYSYSLICLQFVPGLVLWYLSLGNVRSAHTAYGRLIFKLYALFSPTDFGPAPAPLDSALCLVTTMFLVLAIAARALRIVPEMRLPIAALIIAAILMPNVANGSWLADIRVPVILPFVVLAGSELRLARESLGRGLATVALIFFGLRIWTVSQSWQDYERWFDEFRHASAVIAPGARLLVVRPPFPAKLPPLPGVPSALATTHFRVIRNMGALAVIDRSVFSPYLFMQATPLAVTPRNAAVTLSSAKAITPALLIKGANPEMAKSLYTGPGGYGQRPYWRNWPRTFDYVLWIDFNTNQKPHLKQLKPVAVGIWTLPRTGVLAAADEGFGLCR